MKKLAIIPFLFSTLAFAQTTTTTDSLLNTGIAATGTYNASSHTSGVNTIIHPTAAPSNSLWLMYTDPFGITSGSGTITQAYSGSGTLNTTMSLTGLPGGGVDAYPFVLYGCDPYSDCYQNQPPQFPAQLSSLSALNVDINYSLTGTITGSDIDLLFDEWVCNSSSPSDSSQCLEVEVLPYYSFVDFGGGTFIKTLTVPATINGTVTTISFDEYKGGNISFYPHTMPGVSAQELAMNLLTFLTEGVATWGDSSYTYVAGIELGTEFGASSSQSYALSLSKLQISETPVGSSPWSGLLAPARAIDWSTAGAGTIPARTTICSTISAGASISTVNAAIAACPANETVLLSAGNYSFPSEIDFLNKNNVTLRGAGPNQTFVAWTAETGCQGLGADVCIESADNGNYAGSPSNIATWTAGYARGATSITLGSVTHGSISNLQVGSLLILDQLDVACTPGTGDYEQTGLGASDGSIDPSCSWQGAVSGRAGRGQNQTVTVTSISGSGPWTIGISPGLYSPTWSSGQSPQVWWGSGLPATGIGIENMSLNHSGVRGSSGPYGMGIAVNNCSGCWIKNVRSLNDQHGVSEHFETFQSVHVTIDSNYAYGSSGASEGYGADCSFSSSDNLIINNIFNHVSAPLITQGCQGSVIAYNFGIDDYFPGNNQGAGASHHSVGDAYNLYEGNQVPSIIADDIHGTEDMPTYKGNWISGRDPNTSDPKTNTTVPLLLATYNRYANIVGNDFGTIGYHNTYQNTPSSSTDCSSVPWTVIYSFGYAAFSQTVFSPSCSGATYTIYNDTNVHDSVMRWQNYDVVTAALRACTANATPTAACTEDERGDNATTYPGLSSPSTTIPASFFLASQPSFWGSVPWPSVGPSVVGGPAPGGYGYNNPASNCYHNVMGGLDDGSSGALTFNPASCYGTAPPQAAPPQQVDNPPTAYVSGTYTFSPVPMSFTCTTPGCVIRCNSTTDGSTPATPTSSTPITSFPQSLTLSTNFICLSTASGYTPSATTGGSWVLTAVGAPTGVSVIVLGP